MASNGLQLAGRARYEAQHLRGRRLPLKRLGELLLQIGVGLVNMLNVSFRLRLLHTTAARMRSALYPFARQGHLVGMVD
jgi:hypothetical protein